MKPARWRGEAALAERYRAARRVYSAAISLLSDSVRGRFSSAKRNHRSASAVCSPLMRASLACRASLMHSSARPRNQGAFGCSSVTSQTHHASQGKLELWATTSSHHIKASDFCLMRGCRRSGVNAGGGARDTKARFFFLQTCNAISKPPGGSASHRLILPTRPHQSSFQPLGGQPTPAEDGGEWPMSRAGYVRAALLVSKRGAVPRRSASCDAWQRRVTRSVHSYIALAADGNFALPSAAAQARLPRSECDLRNRRPSSAVHCRK